MRLEYHVLDVFTSKALAGNPLAVVDKADGLNDNEMQAIAAEFNLSETVFIRRAMKESHTAALRIFTPKVELPFAGHPTVGAAVLLGLQRRAYAVRLEEQVGLVTCVTERTGKRSGKARFGLPVLPIEAGQAPAREAIAETLGLAPEDIGCGVYEPALFSAGVPFYLVPVRDADALARIKLERRGWGEVYPEGNQSVYVFAELHNEQGLDFGARMFSPGMGIDEDPATGSAAAALLGLLARHAEMPDGLTELKLRQGVEMGRPSTIELQYHMTEGKLVHCGIGGEAVIVAEGVLDLF